MTGTDPPRRGECPSCLRRHRRCRDGTLGRHQAPGGGPCPGTGSWPAPLAFDQAGRPRCGRCLLYLYSTPHLGEAISSVAIENGGDPAAMLRRLLSDHHFNDHRTSPGTGPGGGEKG